MIKILDFYADWCRPCKLMAPILNDIAASNESITLVKVNMDNDEEGLAEPYGVMSIPTLLIFVDDILKDRIVGAVPKVKVMEVLNKYIKD
ncbi:MAG: thioredoxin family protein [Candidatus Saccharimonadaceae bacterium]